MKKIITTVLTALFLTTSATAFFDSNGMPCDNYNNGYQEDNGIFAYNSFDYLDPRWYSTEFTNIVNEIDDEFDNSSFTTTSYQSASKYNFAPTQY